MARKNEADEVAEHTEDPVAYRYRGGGDFVPGLPARDLTQADVAALNTGEIEASGLYEKAVTP